MVLWISLMHLSNGRFYALVGPPTLNVGDTVYVLEFCTGMGEILCLGCFESLLQLGKDTRVEGLAPLGEEVLSRFRLAQRYTTAGEACNAATSAGLLPEYRPM